MEITNPDYTIVQLIAEFGFAIIAVVGLAYFIYYIWNFISEKIDPKIEEMHMQLIRVIDQVRMLDQDLIRLQETRLTFLHRHSQIRTLRQHRCLLSSLGK